MVGLSKKERAKDKAASYACELIRDGMLVGLGSGTTSELFVRHLAQHKKAIKCVATSDYISALAQSLGLEMEDGLVWDKLDITIDGADQIDDDYNLIKGLGGALLREKIIAFSSKLLVIIADEGKRVSHLGLDVPIPVEVSAHGLKAARHHLADLVGSLDDVRLRVNEAGKIFKTDSGNYIYDCFFERLIAVQKISSLLDELPFVMAHGLFLGLADRVIIGKMNGELVIEDKDKDKDRGGSGETI